MPRLTVQERRRIYLTQQQAHAATLALLQAPTPSSTSRPAPTRRWILAAAVTAAALGGAALASHLVEFHPPGSLLDALLPRL